MALPRLREELDLLPGPLLPDGQPSWTLHDPVRNLFYRIDWPSFELLSRWDLDDPAAVASAVGAATPLNVGEEDIKQLIAFLGDNQLLAPAGTSTAAQMAERLQRLRGSPFKRLLHNYLFFRVPLLRPDAWLERWQPVAALLYTRGFLLLTLGALGLGMLQVLRRWDSFLATLVDTFTWDGLLAYGLALMGVKLLHELGHAFTAKRYGCRVPTMGVAFLVLWPMAYTDTNESWRLTAHRQRLAVASAGIATELAVAAWATLAWALLPEGGLRSAAFFLATTSWLATLAINASPFMRFDGYFIVSDALDMPNLHGRSFALARWKLREWLFGLGDAPPEQFAAGKQAAMIGFAWATWVYRLVVFLGIALLVYSFFIKLLGILLFIVEIAWFIAMPVQQEFKAWRQLWPRIRVRTRWRRAGALALLALGLFLLPWPGRVMVSGVLRPAEVWPVFAPAGAQVASLGPGTARLVQPGETLLVLASPELAVRRELAVARLDRLRLQADASGFEGDSRNRMQSTQVELATVQAELAGLDEEMQRFRPQAPFAGRWHDVDPDLHPGQWLARKEKAGLVVAQGPFIVETYLDEEAVKRVRLGDGGIFMIESAAGPVLRVRVTGVDADATRVLPQGLASVQSGGHVLTRERNGQLFPERSVYRVTLAVESALGVLAERSWRGHLVIRAGWEVPAWRYLRSGLSVLVREGGF